ncbi:MAG: GxxExxY protein [Spirochaetales bacterium]|nr:GxxExxY protein [Spirochaetales bacterium]
MITGDDNLTDKIIACAIAVHRELGPGLLESIYEEALGIELAHAGLSFNRQVELPVVYKGLSLSGSFRVDMVVENSVVLELKCVDAIAPVHQAQILSYMRLGGWKIGLLLNFKSAILKDGIRRVVL